MLPAIPTSVRIATLAMLLALISNAVVIGFIHVRVSDEGTASLRHQLSQQSDILVDVYRTGGTQALAQTIRDSADDDPQAIAALYRDGRQLAGAGYDVGSTASPEFRIVKADGADLAVFARRLDPHLTLISGRGLGERMALQRTLERSLLLALALSLVLGLLGALLITRFVSGRVAEIAQVIDHVGEGDLSRRVPTGSAGDAFDAFDALGRRINATLDKVVALMDELRLLTDSLAHDLRSPIGRLRARIERALTTPDERQRDTLLAGVLDEADALTRMLTTVLEIGRTEAMRGRQRLAWLDPVELIDELGDMYEPLAEEAGLRLERRTSGVPLPVAAHRQLLAQAISNLVDNALKHGRGGERIELGVEAAGDEVRITIRDQGPGIPAERHQEALRRFGRLDPSRSVPGAGLGLALVEAVAQMHGGRLELGDAEPGLAATIVLPVRSALPEPALAIAG